MAANPENPFRLQIAKEDVATPAAAGVLIVHGDNYYHQRKKTIGICRPGSEKKRKKTFLIKVDKEAGYRRGSLSSAINRITDVVLSCTPGGPASTRSRLRSSISNHPSLVKTFVVQCPPFKDPRW